MPIAPNHLNHLKELKDKLLEQKLSVLVGAGFSKNVHAIFPSWAELLYDMTEFLFESQIEIEYNIYTSANGAKSTETKEAFIEKRVWQLIDEVGYLEIVSSYIKRKGFHESIATYIEEKTPRLVQSGNKTYLKSTLRGKSRKVPLKEEMLLQHRLLLGLPWNNIYTTNYDEMLEEANDKATPANIEDELRSIDDEISELNRMIDELSVEIDELKKQLDEHDTPAPSMGFYPLIQTETNRASLHTSQGQEIRNTLSRKEGELRSRNAQKETKEKDRARLRKALAECLSVVRSAKQLSVKRNRNIIKLHGSLRKEEDSFGFDGDLRTQYVISKEHYEQYPVKHEAFTQLMRISLLQESYCLIGFSGGDSNFIEWVKWVRDILGSDRQDGGAKEFKIYLIDVEDSEPSADKLLFFQNHRICRLPLRDESVIQVLEEKTGESGTDRKSVKALMTLFLRYMSKSANLNYPRAAYEDLQLSKYNSLWDSINPRPYPDEDISVGNRIKNADRLIQLKKSFRIAQVDFAVSGTKQSLLFFLENLLNKSEGDPAVERMLLSLAVVAIKDTFLSLGTLWAPENFKAISRRVEEHPDVKWEFDLLRLKEAILIQDDLQAEIHTNELSKIALNEYVSQELVYQSILNSAFSFDFAEVKRKLDEWKPSSHWVLKKCGLLCHFDLDEAIVILSEHVRSMVAESDHEQLYTLQLLRFLKQGNLFGRRDEEIHRQIEALKSKGLKDISANLDSLFDGVISRGEELKPYGHGRFTITSNGRKFSNDTTIPQKGVQFLQILIESGFPLVLRGLHWRDDKSWYPVFKAIFWYYPYPTLFYSLQYSNEDFLKRIGQDYSFSEELKENLDEIISKLLNAYVCAATSPRYKKGILFFCSQIIESVAPKVWESAFVKIWNEERFVDQAFDIRRPAQYAFASSATRYVQGADTIRMILETCIRNSDKDILFDYLKALHNSQAFKRQAKQLQNPTLRTLLNSVIARLTTDQDAWYFVHYLEPLLTIAQKKKITIALNAIDYSRFTEETPWSSILFFANGDSAIVTKLRNEVIRNQWLWDAGFSPDGSLSSYSRFIHLSGIERTLYVKDGIVWSDAEATKIFERLKTEMVKIDAGLKRWEDHNFRFILQEMHLFLTQNETQLKGQSDYRDMLRKVETLYFKHRGYTSLVEGIMSSDSSEVVWVLGDISNAIRRGRTPASLEEELSLLVNKVLLQTEPSIEACLGFIASWMNDVPDLFSQQQNQLISLLTQYRRKELPDCDRSFVQHQLVIIANALSKSGVKHEMLDYWESERNNTRFNRVKFFDYN